MTKNSSENNESDRLIGRCIEIGDDDQGRPRLIIHTTRDAISAFKRNLVFTDVEVRVAPPNRI